MYPIGAPVTIAMLIDTLPPIIVGAIGVTSHNGEPITPNAKSSTWHFVCQKRGSTCRSRFLTISRLQPNLSVADRPRPRVHRRSHRSAKVEVPVLGHALRTTPIYPSRRRSVASFD